MDPIGKSKGGSSGSSIVSKVLRAAVGSVGVRVAASILGLAVTAMLTRVLGKSGLGVYAYVLSTANLLSLIAVFGFDRLIIRETGAASASGDWSRLRGLIRVAGLVSTLLALVLGGGLVLVTFLVPELFDSRYLVPYRVLVLLVPLLTLGLVQQSMIRGLKWVVAAQLPQQLLRPAFMLSVLAIATWWAIELHPEQALLWLAGAILFGLLVGAGIHRRVRPAPLADAPAVHETRAWLVTCLPIMGVALANKGSGDIASIVLGTVSTPDELADFTVSRQMAKFLRFIFIAINLSIGPTIAHLHAEGRLEELRSLGPRTVRFATAVVLPVVVAMLFLPGLFLGVYGEEYLDQSSVFRVMVVTEFVNIVLGSVAIWLMMTGYEKLALRGALAGLAVGIALNLALAPGLGALGTAIALLAGLVVTKLVLWRYIQRHLGINPTLFGRG